MADPPTTTPALHHITTRQDHVYRPINQPKTNVRPSPQLPHQKAPNAEKRHPVDQLSATHSNPDFSFPPLAGAPNPEKRDPVNQNRRHAARAKMKLASRHVVVALVLAIHLGVDALMIIGLLTWYGEIADFAAIAWPMAQGCLLAIWAAIGRTRFSLRLPLALAGTIVAWFALLGVTWSDAEEAAGYAVLLAVQLLAILLLSGGGRLLRRQFRLWRSEWTETDARTTQFSLRQLLLLTALVAIILGSGKAACGWLGWNSNLPGLGRICVICSVLAICNSMYALLALAFIAVKVPWPMRILLFLLLVASVGGLACSMHFFFQWPLGYQGRLSVSFCLMLAASQVIYHTMTLWPLRLSGYLGHTDVDPNQTTPATDNPFAQ